MSSIIVSRERREGLGTFVAEGGFFARFDTKVVVGLSNEEFAERYLGEMTRYFYEHGREMLQTEACMREMGIDGGLEIFGCFDCHLPIESPRDLRRYYGNSLHHDCFVRRWKEEKPGHVERHGRDVTFRYWQKVAELKL